MKLEELGGPAECTRCKKTFPGDQLIYEGEDYEPICFKCLKEVDGPKMDVLSKIHGLRPPKSLGPADG